MTLSPAELEAEHVHGHRWWTLAELHAYEGRFSPRELPWLIERVLKSGPPTTPFQLGL